MKKFVSPRQDCEVIGAAMLAYHTALEHDRFKHILEDCGLDHINPEAWYPQQLSLDVQHRIKEEVGSLALVSVGMRVIEEGLFPPVSTLEEAVNMLAEGFRLNIRNADPREGIQLCEVRPGQITVVNATPHSDDLVYGYIYALVNRFHHPDTHPIVVMEDVNKIDSDGDMLFHIQW